MNRPTLVVAALGATLILAACARTPVIQPTPLPMATSYANVSPAHDAAVPELRDWWRRFDDPVLDQLVQTALAENLDLKSAVARIDAARAVRVGTAAEGKPQIDLNAGANRQRWSAAQSWTFDPVIADNDSLNASASWELDIFGRIRKGVAAADADIISAQEDAQAVQVAVIGEVVQTYLTVRGLDRRLTLVGTNAHNQEATETFTRQMFDAGEVPLADVNRAQAQHETTAAQLPALELQRQTAIHRLAIITASTPQQVYALLNPAARQPSWATYMEVGTPADLLRLRPDVKAAEARVVAAYSRVGVAEADLKPHLRLVGVLGAAVNGFSGATFARSIAWMAGANATTPLFDGKRRRSVVALRRAEAEQALYAYRASVLAAVSEVETARAATVRNSERVEGLTRATSSARSAYEQIHQSWRSGESPFIDTLEVQRTLLDAEDALAQAQTVELQSQASLMTALGQGR